MVILGLIIGKLWTLLENVHLKPKCRLKYKACIYYNNPHGVI